MKKLVALALALVVVLACFAGCGTKGKTLADIKNAGEIVIATSPDFPPFEELQADGSVVGIEIDIWEAIAEELGVKLTIKQMDFEAVLPGIIAGKFDAGVSGISVTDARKKNSLFTNPYCLAAQAIVVTSDSPIKTKADLDGKTVSVQSGTTAEEYCLSQNYIVSAFAANSDAEAALTSAKVDAWVIDDLTAAEMVKAYNEEHEDQLVILDDPMTTEPYAFAFALGSDELVGEINKIVDKLVEDGTVKSFFDKYEAPYTSPQSK
ncbi:MAG: amino acid ABC transporter substrate-binding protein [Clostridia bacterium]|nr:amino acid ABC transporter substrate-binding protein [Clostridia bacterium]